MLIFNRDRCDLCGICIEVCPFDSLSMGEDMIIIHDSCRLCGICVNKCPHKALTIEKVKESKTFLNEWKGIMVFAEYMNGEIHPITFELIGKAKELAAKIHHPVYCILIGHDLEESSKDLLRYGIDKLFLYDNEEFDYYREDLYSKAFEECINHIKPSVVLVGATAIGRSLAPRLATRFKTGLTADCTFLDIKENSDLVQIRPAFGGNIMAQIVTENARPQFATVRHKVMDKAEVVTDLPADMLDEKFSDIIERRELSSDKLKSRIEILEIIEKEREESISEAEIIVVGGRGLKDKKDLAMIEALADLLGGQVGVTRPLVEAGWASYTKQIGLSGRTVKPKLIITCGVSGAIQFRASMDGSECIIAINNDKDAPIFEISDYGIIGDIYEVVPGLCDKLKGEKKIEV